MHLSIKQKRPFLEDAWSHPDHLITAPDTTQFSALIPAPVKALGFFAFPINQIGSFPDPSELQQKSALNLDFSFPCPGRARVERP